MIDRGTHRAGIVSGALVLTMALAPLYVDASVARQDEAPRTPTPEATAARAGVLALVVGGPHA